MKGTVLIVEDQFIEANTLKNILKMEGYPVLPIAHSVEDARQIMERHTPGIVLLDIQLRGALTGIDLAASLREKNIPFVYLSANSDKPVVDAAIATKPWRITSARCAFPPTTPTPITTWRCCTRERTRP